MCDTDEGLMHDSPSPKCANWFLSRAASGRFLEARDGGCKASSREKGTGTDAR